MTIDELEYIKQTDLGPFELSEYLGWIRTKYRYSERALATITGISKSQIHRSLALAKVPEELRRAVKEWNIDIWVCHRWVESSHHVREILGAQMRTGEILRHADAVALLKHHSPLGSRSRRAMAKARQIERLKAKQEKLEEELKQLSNVG